MIKVTLKNIMDFELPLDNHSKVIERGTSEEILRRLEKKHNVKTFRACSKGKNSEYEIYENEAFKYIPEQDKNMWLTNYEVYIRSSFKYKLWIAIYKLAIAFEE